MYFCIKEIGEKGSELDLDFMSKVANTPRGKGILSCIQCGRCASGCPIVRSAVPKTGNNYAPFTDKQVLARIKATLILGEVYLGVDGDDWGHGHRA